MKSATNGFEQAALTTNGLLKNDHSTNGFLPVESVINDLKKALKEAMRGDAAGTYVVDSIRNESELHQLVEYAIDYSHCIGLIGRTAEHKGSSDVAEFPPLALLPSPFPQELYEHATSVQQTLNELYFRISIDHDFLVETYKDVVKGDPFIRRLIEMLEIVHAEGIHQRISMGLTRADYLTHWDENVNELQLKQVEVNIGQIGGPGHGTNTSKMHSRLLGRLEALHNDDERLTAPWKSGVLPENVPGPRMAQTIYEAWKLFGDPKAVVLLVQQADLFPITYFEQLHFSQFELEDLAKADGHQLNVFGINFQECAKRLRLDEANDFSLYLDGNRKVALIHMGYGYHPDHYPTETEWKVRMDMERSTAIVSPNLSVQLSGTKKIQQVLSEPGTLERFFPAEKHAELAQLRQTFIDLWGLESNDQNTVAVIQEAIKTPGKFVLKSNLGAGKGNFFDEELAEKLRTMSLEERGAYILQKKIVPVVAKNYMLRPFVGAHLETVVSEVGIYGSLLGDCLTGSVLRNTVDGHLLRSKKADVNQGGVSEGSGVIDSLILFPSSDFYQT